MPVAVGATEDMTTDEAVVGVETGVTTEEIVETGKTEIAMTERKISKEDLLEIKLIEEQLAHAETTLKFLVVENSRVQAMREGLNAKRLECVTRLRSTYDLKDGDRIDSDGLIMPAETAEKPAENAPQKHA